MEGMIPLSSFRGIDFLWSISGNIEDAAESIIPMNVIYFGAHVTSNAKMKPIMIPALKCALKFDMRYRNPFILKKFSRHGGLGFLREDSGEIKISQVLPRCKTCGKFPDYAVVNKKSGQAIYLCENCGLIQLLQFRNNSDWEIIHLK